jgi:hypothetical protein
MIDLNDFAVLGPHAALVEATGINNVGQIVANGKNSRAYLIAVPSGLR